MNKLCKINILKWKCGIILVNTLLTDIMPSQKTHRGENKNYYKNNISTETNQGEMFLEDKRWDFMEFRPEMGNGVDSWKEVNLVYNSALRKSAQSLKF